MDENLLKSFPYGLCEIIKKVAQACLKQGKSVIEIAQTLKY
jgi:hypothetical protein